MGRGALALDQREVAFQIRMELKTENQKLKKHSLLFSG